jgi:hypothetical protein
MGTFLFGAQLINVSFTQIQTGPRTRHVQLDVYGAGNQHCLINATFTSFIVWDWSEYIVQLTPSTTLDFKRLSERLLVSFVTQF